MANSITKAMRTIKPSTIGRCDPRLFCKVRKEAVWPTTVTCPGPWSDWSASTDRCAAGDNGAEDSATLDSHREPPGAGKTRPP